MIFPKGNSSHHLERMGEFLQSVVKFTLKLTSYVKGDSAYTITVDTYIQPHKIYKSKVPVHP